MGGSYRISLTFVYQIHVTGIFDFWKFSDPERNLVWSGRILDRSIFIFGSKIGFEYDFQKNRIEIELGRISPQIGRAHV